MSEALRRKLKPSHLWIVESCYKTVNSSDFVVPLSAQKHMVWQSFSERICVRDMFGLQSGGPLCECINLNMNDFRLPAATERTNLNLSDLQLPVSSQIIMRAQKLYNSSQIWTLCVYSWIWATSGWLFLHKWTWDGNGCQRKYVLATCAALNPDIIMIKGLAGCWDKTSG